MASRARSTVVRNGAVATYHTWSRCVQRMYLLERNPQTGVRISPQRSRESRRNANECEVPRSGPHSSPQSSDHLLALNLENSRTPGVSWEYWR